METNRAFLVAFICVLAGFGVTLATPLEEEFILLPGWVPGVGGDAIDGDIIKAEHNTWHGVQFDLPDDFNPANDVQGREFLEFHREFLAYTDDFRLFAKGVAGAFPFPAVVPVVAQPGSTLKFDHTGYGCPRIAPADITVDPDGPGGCHLAVTWTRRTSNLMIGDPTFHGYSVHDLGVNIQTFHNEGHGAIATHRPVDMQWQKPATRDGAFFQWHKNIDNIFADWAVGQYQGVLRSGKPVFFSVSATAIGRQATDNALKSRKAGPVYQGYKPPSADQYGASARTASDIYVGDSDGKNLLYAAGTREWSSASDAWDVDAWSILNPSGNGWYFSVTMGSTGLAGDIIDPLNTFKGGDVFDSTAGGTNTFCRSETSLGLEPALTDELDALEIDRERRVQGTDDSNSAGVYDRPQQWFSLRAGWTQDVLAFSGALVGPNDILRFNENGELVIEIPAALLGLVAGDDLDALVIVDGGVLNTLDAGDLIYYSLAAGSPSLGAGSAADIRCWPMGGAAGAFCPALAGPVAVAAAALGLAPGDDLDALDVRRGACGGFGGAVASSRLQTDPPLPGACCHAQGPGPSCTEVLATSCVAPGDTFRGEETVCATAGCPSFTGACCLPIGSCTTSMTDQACLQAAGTFQGPGTTTCSPACPIPPSNDECANAIVIPYTFSSGYEPPADNTNATIPAYFQPRDPAYSCKDPRSFSGPFGAGTLWYSYTVPSGPAPRRSIVLSTQRAAQFYPTGGGAGDTRLAMYFSSSGNCSTLQEVACTDNNIPGNEDPATTNPINYYATLQYNNPVPGTYFILLSTTYNTQRGRTYLAVTDPNPSIPASTSTSAPRIPAVSPWGLALLTLVLMGAGALVLRSRW